MWGRAVEAGGDHVQITFLGQERDIPGPDRLWQKQFLAHGGGGVSQRGSAPTSPWERGQVCSKSNGKTLKGFEVSMPEAMRRIMRRLWYLGGGVGWGGIWSGRGAS